MGYKISLNCYKYPSVLPKEGQEVPGQLMRGRESAFG